MRASPEFEAKHAEWYKQACEAAEGVGVVPLKPRTCGRQTHRGNAETATTEAYYRVHLTAPFLDYLVSEFETRYDSVHALHWYVVTIYVTKYLSCNRKVFHG